MGRHTAGRAVRAHGRPLFVLPLSPPATPNLATPQPLPAHPILTFLKSHLLPPGSLPHSSELSPQPSPFPELPEPPNPMLFLRNPASDARDEPHISWVTSPAGPGRILLGLLLPAPLRSSPKKGLGICLWMANAIVSKQHTRGFLLSHCLLWP